MDLFKFSALVVWVLPLVSSVLVPVIGRRSAKARNAFVIAITAIVAFLAFTLIPAVYSGLTLSYVLPLNVSNFSLGVYLDPLSVLFTCLVGFFGLIIAVYSLGYMKGEKSLDRYFFLFLLFIGSMIGIVISDNFLQMFFFWEMVGLCSWALIGFWYNRPEPVKAGSKALLMTRIGDVLLLAGICVLYVNLGTFSFHQVIVDIQNGMLSSGALVTVAFLFLGGAVAKSAQLPLHTWLFSAMEAPTSVSALLHAATMVKAGVYLVARFVLIASVSASLFAALQPIWLPTLAWIGILTAFTGATLALATPDMKGVLAYSTMSQLGFMMAALGTALNGSSSIGWFASLFHTISHAFFEGLGFLLAGGIIHAVGTRDMRLMGGLRKAMPLTFALALVMILTTSGLPPFAAFFSKGLVITSVIDAGNLLQIIMIFATTMITFAYSLRFMKLIFLGEPSEHVQNLNVHETEKVMLIPAAVLSIGCFTWGFSMSSLGRFMGLVQVPALLGSFSVSEAALSGMALVAAALLVYATYWKNNHAMTALRNPQNPLNKLISNGYFIDTIYEKGVVASMIAFGQAIKYSDILFSEIWLKASAGRLIQLAHKVTAALDSLTKQLLNLLANGTLLSPDELKKTPSFSLEYDVFWGVQGLIMITVATVIIVIIRGL